MDKRSDNASEFSRGTSFLNSEQDLNPQSVTQAVEIIIASAKEKDPLKRAILDLKAFNVQYGYIGISELQFRHIKFNSTVRSFYHPWAADQWGHTYGVREYEKVIPLKDYMTLPVDLVDDLLEGVLRGQTDLIKIRKEAADKVARQQGGVTDPGKAAINNALREDKRHG